VLRVHPVLKDIAKGEFENVWTFDLTASLEDQGVRSCHLFDPPTKNVGAYRRGLWHIAEDIKN
jgi:hypothetical protein